MTPLRVGFRFKMFLIGDGNDESWIRILFLQVWPAYQNHISNYFSFSYISWIQYSSWFQLPILGWSGVAKVSCILCHRGVQLILAYSWARPAILVASKGRGGMFFISSVFFSLSFLFLFLTCPSLSSPLLSFLSLFFLSLGDSTKWPKRVDVTLNPNIINQSVSQKVINV